MQFTLLYYYSEQQEAHINLKRDWIGHTVIINSCTYSYADSTWFPVLPLSGQLQICGVCCDTCCCLPVIWDNRRKLTQGTPMLQKDLWQVSTLTQLSWTLLQKSPKCNGFSVPGYISPARSDSKKSYWHSGKSTSLGYRNISIYSMRKPQFIKRGLAGGCWQCISGSLSMF